MNPKAVSIRGVNDGTELILSAEDFPASDVIEVSVTGLAITARRSTSTYHVGSPALFFEHIATHWRGWDGEYRWATLENDFQLFASTDKLGHVELRVEMKGDAYPPEWETKVRLFLEAGSLEDIFRKVRAVFPIHEGAPRS